jgi:hypothetical protein
MNKHLLMGSVMITLATVGIITVATMAAQQSFGISMPTLQRGTGSGDDGGPKAPTAISGDNIYITWWTNATGNEEIMFRASSDGGTTFMDKINLSNSTDADSEDVEIAADGDHLIITWWERNQTAEEPVVRISSNAGATFGPLLKLASNGTIGEASEEE